MENQTPEKGKSDVEQAGEDLFNYAIERDDIKYLLALLPPEAEVKPNKVDYELQILKIITVGWSISFHLREHPLKNVLGELYWQAVQEFSHTLSETTGLMIGQDIDYFVILKERLDMYVDALARKPGAQEAVEVIGPEFAGLCGDAEDIFTRMAGSKLFLNVTTRVKQYLETVWNRTVH